MKTTILSAICFMLMVYAGLAVVLAQETTPLHPSKLKARWTHTGLGADGTTPVTIAYFLLAASAADVDLRVSDTGIAAQLVQIDECDIGGNTYEIGLETLLADVTLTEIKIWVAAIGVNGSMSQWSDPCQVAIDNSTPEKPVLEIRRTRPLLLRR